MLVIYIPIQPEIVLISVLQPRPARKDCHMCRKERQRLRPICCAWLQLLRKGCVLSFYVGLYIFLEIFTSACERASNNEHLTVFLR